MPKQLLSASIAAPGFFGVNTQESGTTLEAGFAIEANNCVIDESGRLGARKGYTYLTQGSTGVNLDGIHEYVGDTGYVDHISWGNGSIYKGTSTLTTLETGHGASEWKATNFIGNCYLAQDGYPVKVIDSNLTISNLASQGAQNFGTVNAAYGRLWAARTSTDKHTVYFTAIGRDDFQGHSGAGEMDLRNIWTNGGDEIVQISGFNGYIIVFCKNCIVVLGDNNNGDLTLTSVEIRVVEVLENVGCIAAGSIQNIGTDILFLSTSGVRSLNRVIQEKSNPIADVSSNVRDDLNKQVKSENLNKVTGIYSPFDSMYLLILPANDLIYCFDTRGRLEDGSFRVTTWSKMGARCGAQANTNKLYLGFTNGIGVYQGYLDNNASYYLTYFTNYFDFGQPTITKLMKHIGVTLIGGSGQEFKIKTAVDYNDVYRTYTGSVQQSTVSEYNTNVEYNDPDTYDITSDANPDKITTDVYTAAEYGGYGFTEKIKLAIGGQGSVVQLGFEAEVNGDPLSIQKLDIYVKQGRSY